MEGYSLYSEKDRGGMGTYYAYPSMTSRMLDADAQIMAKSGATLAGSGLNNVTDFIKSVNTPLFANSIIALSASAVSNKLKVDIVGLPA